MLEKSSGGCATITVPPLRMNCTVMHKQVRDTQNRKNIRWKTYNSSSKRITGKFCGNMNTVITFKFDTDTLIKVEVKSAPILLI